MKIILFLNKLNFNFITVVSVLLILWLSLNFLICSIIIYISLLVLNFLIYLITIFNMSRWSAILMNNRNPYLPKSQEKYEFQPFKVQNFDSLGIKIQLGSDNIRRAFNWQSSQHMMYSVITIKLSLVSFMIYPFLLYPLLNDNY